MSDTPNVNFNAMQLLLADIQRLYDNSKKYIEVCSQAISSDEDIIEVSLTNDDGSITSLQVPSFANIQRRMQVFENNMAAIVGMQNGKDLYAQLVDSNNQIRTLVHMSLLNRPEAITSLKGSIATDNNVVKLGNELLDRTTTLGMHVQVDVTGKVSSYMSKCQITKFILSDEAYAKMLKVVQTTGIELSYAGFIAELDAANYVKSVDYDVEDYSIDLRARRATSTGSFNILFKRLNSNGTLSVKLDTLQYNSVDAAITGSLTLKVGDTVSTPIGDVIFTIASIDVLSQTAVLSRKTGINSMAASIKKLVYVDDVVQKVVDIPIRHSEKFVAFLSPIHDAYNTIAAYSPALFVDVSTLTIRTEDNELINANKYMLALGDSNIGAYVEAIATDMQPPAKYAIKPSKPTLNVDEYKVIQLNTHLTDNINKTQILQLYEQKRSLQQEIGLLDSDISKLQLQLNTYNFKNDSERKNVQEQYLSASRNRAQKVDTLTEIVDNMLNINSQAYDALYDPKFRIRGFLPVQTPSISRWTSPQNIIQFKVQYRYVSLNDTIAKSDTFDIEQDGKTTSAAFSTWNEVFTPLRRKIIVDGKPTWEPINADSIESISCNQIDIPITPNEKVQIRVKAIGEAGYPNVLNESDWSNIMTIAFPDSLAPNAQFVTLKDELLVDKQSLLFENMLTSKGVTEHISTALTENNVYFAHSAQNLASGFYTSELSRISAYEKLLSMSNAIEQLKDIIINKGSMLRVSIIDDEGNESEILNGSTTVLYAGAYSDKFDLTNKDNYGAILSKQYYIKFTNIGTSALSLYPKYHGVLSDAISNIQQDNIYNAPLAPLSSAYDGEIAGAKQYWPAPFGSRQLKGQILYAGVKNVAGTTDLYAQPIESKNVVLFDDADIVEDAQSNAKIYVRKLVDGSYTSVALKPGAESKYLTMNIKHPLYVAYLSAEDKTYAKQMLDNEFAIMENKFNSMTKDLIQQGLPTTNLSYDIAPKVLYIDNDKYLAGSNTRGAFLTLIPKTQTAIQVTNSSDSAALSIEPGTNKSVLVPLIFQARMTDMLGQIDMQSTLDAAQFSYVKTINLHTYISGKEFVFDIKVYADFRSSTSIIGAIPVASMQSLLQ